MIARAKEFIKLQGEGLSFYEIGQRYGVSRNVVAGVIYRATKPEAIKAYRSAVDRQKVIDARTERLFGRKSIAARAKPRKALDRDVLRLFGEGLSIMEIGDHCGFSHETARKIIKDCCELAGFSLPPRRFRMNSARARDIAA